MMASSTQQSLFDDAGAEGAGRGGMDGGLAALGLDGAAPESLTLTEEQRAAVSSRSGPLLLAAAAGSGKTSVLVERFVSAMLLDGVRPDRILAITFTERAAWELKERLRKRLREMRHRDLARDVEGASVGTFHGFCARLLRADPLTAGLLPGFSILDEPLAGRLRLAAYGDALRETLAGEDRQAVDVVAAYGVDRLRKIVLGVHSELRSKGLRHPSLPAVQAGEAEAAACAVIGSLLTSFDVAYERRKRARGAADFDDLELCALDLLHGSEALRAQWSQRFDLLMVDEFQDTNPRQLALLSAIERDNLFTVGDEWQSIYGFRHADVSIFQRRREDLAQRGGSLALTLNFRSVPAITAAVNRAFAGRFGDRHTPLRAQDRTVDRLDGVEILLTDKDGWDQDDALAQSLAAGLPAGQLWRIAEARMLARRIFELTEDGAAAPGDVAVLLRSAKDLPLYERAIAAAGLPTHAAAGGFWVDSQVGDLVSYLRALANPRDELALHGALSSPLAGVSADALALLAGAGRRDGGGLWEAVLEATGIVAARAETPRLAERDHMRLSAFARRLQAARRRAPERGIATLLREEIADARYAERLLRLPDGEQRLANVRKLMRLAASFERAEGRDLRGFLDHVAHLEQSAEPDAPIGGGERDAVRLMTIHAAKGLEFPVVCVADLGRAPNRSDVPDMLVDGQRLGLRLLRLGDPASTPTLEYEQLRSEREAAEAEEEDRVLYVAMTRARRRLLLSGAASFGRWPRDAPSCPPIAWLAPALLDGFEALLAGASPSGEEVDAVRCLLNTPEGARATLGLESARAVLDSARADRGSASASAPADGVAIERAEDGLVAETAPIGAQARATPALLGPDDGLALFGPDDPLSYTTLVELERCGYRYYLERVLGLPEGKPPARVGTRGGSRSLDARSRGETAHIILEAVDLEALSDPQPERVVRVARDLGLSLGRAQAQELAQLLAGLPASPLGRRIGQASSLSREQPFSFAAGPAGVDGQGAASRLIVGTFDLVAEERSGRRLIVDYKSDSVASGDDLETLVADRYEAQRLVYALAALRDGATEVEIAHWFLMRPLEPVLMLYEASQRADLEVALAERVERALARGAAVSERPHRRLCLTCPGRESLCSWDERETLREAPKS